MDAIFWNDSPHKTSIFRYIGPYKVAHYLRQHGYNTQVVDFVTNFTEEELWNITVKFITPTTSMLGVSVTFIAEKSYEHTDGIDRKISMPMLNVLRRIKVEYPHIKLILGGYNADTIDHYGVFDASISSYGEDISLELMNFYQGTGVEPLAVKKIPAFGTRPVLNYYQANTPRYNIESDSFQFTKQDGIVSGETLPIEISRGCIFKCKFCNHRNLGRGKLDYLRSFECIKNELICNYELFNTTSYYIVCDTFNDTEYKMNEWYKIISSLPFKITYSAYLRADLIHRFPDTAYQLKETGLFGAFHGIESLHPEASKIVGKGWSGRHAKEFIPKLYHDIWKGQVPQHLTFIAGLPNDTRSSIGKTIDWFLNNNLHSLRFQYLSLKETPTRHPSEFERNAKQYGYQFDSQGNWYLNYINLIEAKALADSLNALLKNQVKLPNWELQSLIGFSKIDKTTLGNTFIHKLNWSQIREQKKIFLTKYQQLVLEL
jgi:radical SAM superfamily enzyme YgiQ (UPF0313 family)